MEPIEKAVAPQQATERELESLRESERRLRAIYEQAPIGISLVDIRTQQFVQFNAKYCEITGLRPEQLLRSTIQSLTFSEDLPLNLEKLDDLRKGACRCFSIEKRYVRPDGGLVWVNVTVVPLWTEGAEPDFYMALTEDISERKAVEAAQHRQTTFDLLLAQILGRFAFCTGPEIDQEIRESLRQLGTFVGSDDAFVTLMAPDMTAWSVVYEWSSSGKSELSEKYHNIPVGQHPWIEQRLFGGEAVQIADAEDWPPEAAFEQEMWQQGSRSLLLIPLRGRGGQVTGTVGLQTVSRPMRWSQEDVRRLRILADAIANVLERKRVETALYNSRQMLRQVLDTIPLRVFWKDADLKYLGCNQTFVRDAGRSSAEEIIGVTDEQILGKENSSHYRRKDLQVMESGQPELNYEEELRMPDGSVSWLRVNKVPLRDYENRIFGILGTYEDVTALRQARLALEQAKEAAEAANQAKDQFIAVLSHELRTPLTPVLAMVTALADSDEVPGRLLADLETIHRNVELEARLIDDLLDVTRISQGKLTLHQEPVDVHACLRSALDICESDLKAKRLRLSVDLKATLFYVWADPARLRQVFWNLIKNAIKFTPEHGRIDLRTGNDGFGLNISIADTGIGIESEAMSRIFNAFEQGEITPRRQFGGLGLGLSIAKAIVEMHHGRLTAASEGRNKGATFTVQLATVDIPPQPPAPLPGSLREEVALRRILLVEDHGDTLQILSRLLRKWGYGVTTASSVQAALDRASEQPFDLIISDLGLPDGSGCELVRQIKGGIPAIALSGYGTEEDVRCSLDAGFSEHLIKPISFQTLRATVERLLRDAG